MRVFLTWDALLSRTKPCVAVRSFDDGKLRRMSFIGFLGEKCLFWYILIFSVLDIMAVVAIYDMVQTRYPILRNFPLAGHGRAVLEKLGPKLRQYIIASNNEERPFDRDQREWIYSSADGENNYFGFGTDNDLERTPGHLIIKQLALPIIEPTKGEAGYDQDNHHPFRRELSKSDRSHALNRLDWLRGMRSFGQYGARLSTIQIV